MWPIDQLYIELRAEGCAENDDLTFFTYKSRPGGFGQSLGRPIVRSFSHFFWSTKTNIVQSQRIFGQSLGICGQPNFFLVYQKFFWLTKFFFGQPKK